MTGELRIPSMHMVIDLKSVAFVSCFQNGRTNTSEKWMLYVWVNGAQDVMSVDILDKAVYLEACEAIDTIGTSNILDTKWKNDIMIELSAYLKDERDTLAAAILNIVRSCFTSHKSKAHILLDASKQLAHLTLPPGLSASIMNKLKL